MSRKYTDMLVDLANNGLAHNLAYDLLEYLSEEQAKDFAEKFGYIQEEEEDEDS
jgi:hypothetical protein